MPSPSSVAIKSCIASALLFLVGITTGSIGSRTTCPNCLVSIDHPYGLFSSYEIFASIGLLFFGLTLTGAILRGRDAKPTRCFLGSGLLSAGVLAILFAVFVYWINLSDEGPRCDSGRCALSLLQQYQAIYTESTLLAILGLVVAVSGTWLLVGNRLAAGRRQPYPIREGA